jgi:AAA-ATPase Vps4-associated protein 1
MCNRETRTVLWNPQDWLYTCDTHLTDPGFATLVVDPAPAASTTKPALSEEELKKIKEEWEDRQKKKKEAAAVDKDGKTTEEDANSAATENKKPPAQLFASPNAEPTHQKYTLHRQIFVMRANALKKKQQASQVKAVAPRLPIAPRGGV